MARDLLAEQPRDLLADEMTAGEAITGATDIVGSALYGLTKQSLEGLSGLGGLAMGRDLKQSVAGAQAMTGALPEYELGESAQRIIGALSEKYQASPEVLQNIVSDYMTLGESLGETTFQKTGSPLLATAARVLPETLEAVTAVKGAQAIPDVADVVTAQAKQAPAAAAQLPAVARQAAGRAGEVVEGVSERAADVMQTPARREMAERIAAGSTDRDLARYTLTGKGSLKADPLARGAINQGFDEGVISAIKGATPASKAKMLKMVDTMQRGKKNQLFAQDNRPTDVAGNALMDRFRVVQQLNERAGSQLDKVAAKLKGQPVDYNPAVRGFLEDLDSMGVRLGDDLKPNFAGSDIEGVPAAERVISQIVSRMRSNQAPDAYQVHRLKRYIDEQVTYGKNAEGLAGRSEMVLKRLRANLDGILDENFPDYDSVNTTYAETRGAIDALQDAAGRKMDLTGPNADKATGTLMRRLMSNAQSRVALRDSIDGIEDVVNRYYSASQLPVPKEGPQAYGSITHSQVFDDDLKSLVLFADELDAVFGPVARTSFQGQIKQGIRTGAEAATSRAGLASAALDLAGEAAERARGINEEGAFKSIRDLLKANK